MHAPSTAGLGLWLCLLAGCDCATPAGPDAGCTAGLGCSSNPGAACFTGVTACAPTGCVDGAARVAGATCGSGHVCDGHGACLTCASGTACDAGPCQLAAIDCSTGAAQCAPRSARDAGLDCGNSSVCDGHGQCVSCGASTPCTSNPGAPCKLGVIQCGAAGATCLDAANGMPGTACGTDHVCNTSGACIACAAGAGCASGRDCLTGVNACSSGIPVCVTSPVPDGTACDGGVCGAGACRATVALGGAINLTHDTLTPGRSCAEAPSFAVTTVQGQGVALSAAPGNCLAVGDEVLLINLQGEPGAVANVGAWETLQVASVVGTTVTFESAMARTYGDAAGSNAGISDGGQKLMLLRVPAFGSLSVTAGASITADGWNGQLGGVVALRAIALQLDGTFTAGGLGYRVGQWSRDDSSCSDSLQTAAGESIDGLGADAPDANYGGSGGLGPAANVLFFGNVPTHATPGHAQPGEPGGNYLGRAAPEPGHAYGSGDGSLLTLGSAAGGDLTCSQAPGPVLEDISSSAAGIIWLHANTLTLGATGRIAADGTASDTRFSGTGGSVMLRGNVLQLGTGQVTAIGGVEPMSGATAAATASPGYVTVFYGTSLTGTTTPAAFSAQAPNP